MGIVLADNAWHVASSFLVFAIGVVSVFPIANKFQISQKKAVFIYIWHTFFCMVYLFFSLNNVADSTSYYINSLEFGSFNLGTGFIVGFTSLFSYYLGLSYIGVFLVYNIIGTVGLLAFYGALNILVKGKSVAVKWMSFLVILLPSVSFWSSALGKEPIAFLSISLALWASLNFRENITLMIFAVLAMFAVRPHMAGIMVIALSIAMLFDKNVKPLGKFILTMVGLVVAAVLVPFAIKFVGLVDISQIAEYFEKRQGYNQEGGSSLDIASMSLPMQLFTYAFRPLPFEAHNIAALFSSFDNLYLLFIFICAVYFVIKAKATNALVNVNTKFLLTYTAAAWIVLAITTANLGISVRQKWMFFPFLIFLCFMVIGKPKSYPDKKMLN